MSALPQSGLVTQHNCDCTRETATDGEQHWSEVTASHSLSPPHSALEDGSARRGLFYWWSHTPLLWAVCIGESINRSNVDVDRISKKL